MKYSDGTIDLKADCTRCAALCCVVFAFDKSESFAIDKAAGEICPHLGAAGRCAVFQNRERLGFPGCIAYDCHGAGQVITQTVFRGQHWRDDAGLATRMGAALSVLRRIHEQLLLLETAKRLPLTGTERERLTSLKEKFLPDSEWTETDLSCFPIEEATREVGSFLKDLRHHAGCLSNARR